MDLPDIAQHFEDAAVDVINNTGLNYSDSDLHKIIQIEAAKAMRDIAQKAKMNIQADLDRCPEGRLGVHMERFLS